MEELLSLADKYASKVWFIRAGHPACVLCGERADSDPTHAQLDTFGGMLEPVDNALAATAARREVYEEAHLPLAWQAALALALDEASGGHGACYHNG